jgi:hypothetical protein
MREALCGFSSSTTRKKGEQDCAPLPLLRDYWLSRLPAGQPPTVGTHRLDAAVPHAQISADMNRHMHRACVHSSVLLFNGEGPRRPRERQTPQAFEMGAQKDRALRIARRGECIMNGEAIGVVYGSTG